MLYRLKLLERLKTEFRKSWEKTEREKHSRDYQIAFSVLHGLLERIPPNTYNPTLEKYFHDSRERLGASTNHLSEIVPILREGFKHGLNKRMIDKGNKDPSFRSKEVRLLYGHSPCRLEHGDLKRIKTVRGWFGMIDKIMSDGLKVILLDEQDRFTSSEQVFPNTMFKCCDFPEAYKEEGAGLCWVQYELDDKSVLGRFEPAST